jgi:dienelactone hydrolase
VLLHGGTGIEPYHPQWASWLAEHGYVAALVDSYRSTTPPTVTMMIGDARGALAYLRTLPFVDPQRIAVMGWSRGAAAALALVTHATGEPTDSRGFRAGILLYPPGCSPRIERAEAPVLLLIGQLDGGSESCMDMSRRLEARAPPPMVAVLYPNTHHAFDDARATAPVLAQAAAGHIMVQFNPAATADARTRVRSFLAEHLRGAS